MKPKMRLETIEQVSQDLATKLLDSKERHCTTDQARELALMVNDLARHCQAIIRMVNGLGIV